MGGSREGTGGPDATWKVTNCYKFPLKYWQSKSKDRSKCSGLNRKEEMHHGRFQRGDNGSGPHLESHKLLQVSLKILVWTTLEKQLDPLGPIAS